MASFKSRMIHLMTGARTVVNDIPSYATATPMLVKNPTARLLEGDYEAQDFITGYEGAQGDRFYNGTMGLDFQMDAYLPEAGVAPLYAPLIEACGFKELITADTSATYSLRPDNETKTEIALRYRDTNAMQVTEAVRGSLSFTAETRRPPMFAFNLMGALFDQQPTIIAPADFSAWPDAPECSPTNMSAFTFNGVGLCVQSFTFSDGRTPRRGKFMNCEDTDITERNFTGRAVVKAPPLGDIDLIQLCRTTEKAPLVWEMAPPGGRTMRVAAPAVQIKFGGQQNIDGEIAINLDLVFTPDQGDDEIAITFS